MIQSRKKGQVNNLNGFDSDEYVQPSLYEGDGSGRNERKLNEKYMNHLQGKWNQDEDLIYRKFIIQNQQKLASKAARRTSKVFKQLAENLNYTRTPEQCRMHHQRMKKKARGRSIQAIIRFINKSHKNLNIKGCQNIEKKVECVQKLEKKKKEDETINPYGWQYEVEYKKVSELMIGVKLALNEIQGW